jgi:hypothetical protein
MAEQHTTTILELAQGVLATTADKIAAAAAAGAMIYPALHGYVRDASDIFAFLGAAAGLAFLILRIQNEIIKKRLLLQRLARPEDN